MRYYLMDARVRQEPDRAVVFEVCYSLKEALEDRACFGDDVVIVAEPNEDGYLGDTIINHNAGH